MASSASRQRASRQRAPARYETTVNITATDLLDALEARILNFEMRCFIYSSANLVLGLFPASLRSEAPIQSLGREAEGLRSALSRLSISFVCAGTKPP